MHIRYQLVISEYLDFWRCAFTCLNQICVSQVFKGKKNKSEISCYYMITKEYLFAVNRLVYPIYIAARSWVLGIYPCLSNSHIPYFLDNPAFLEEQACTCLIGKMILSLTSLPMLFQSYQNHG